MLRLDEVQRLASHEKELAELLAQLQEIDHFYREVVAAMSLPGDKIEPVRSSAEITISFQQGISSNVAANKS